MCSAHSYKCSPSFSSPVVLNISEVFINAAILLSFSNYQFFIYSQGIVLILSSIGKLFTPWTLVLASYLLFVTMVTLYIIEFELVGRETQFPYQIAVQPEMLNWHSIVHLKAGITSTSLAIFSRLL